MTANVSGIDLTLNKVTYINGNPKIDETRSPTDGTKPRSASKKYLSAKNSYCTNKTYKPSTF